MKIYLTDFYTQKYMFTVQGRTTDGDSGTACVHKYREEEEAYFWPKNVQSVQKLQWKPAKMVLMEANLKKTGNIMQT